MHDDKEKISGREQEKEQEEVTKEIAEKTWENDDDWMDDPSGINPGC